MAEFCVSLLDLILVPFQSTSNLIVFVPTAFLVIMCLFALISRLMRAM